MLASLLYPSDEQYHAAPPDAMPSAASARLATGRSAVQLWRRRAGPIEGAAVMTIEVRPLTALFGAEVTGVDLAGPLDGATRRELYRLFADRAVLVFRDQDLDPPRFAAAARVFGEI